MNPRSYDFLRNRQGNAMIEVSLVLPILIFLLLATINLGLLLQQYMAVADAARAGAEYPTNWATSSDTAGMLSAANAAGAGIPGFHAVTAVVCTCGPGGAIMSCTATCASYGYPSQYAQVTASATLPLLFSVNGFPAHYTVQSVARMRVPWTGL